MSVYDDHQPKTEGGGLYLRLADGETVKLRIVSEPVIYDSDYKGKVSTKYAWVVWNYESTVKGGKTTKVGLPQVFQQSATFFKNLANFAKDPEYGDPTGYDIKVTREGMDTDTIYHILPGKNTDDLPQEATEAAKAINLIDAVNKGQGISNVFWLSDFISSGEQSQATTKPTAKSQLDDVVVEDIGDDPINLDDIPY